LRMLFVQLRIAQDGPTIVRPFCFANPLSVPCSDSRSLALRQR